MRIGVDFDNTIACYEGIFHAHAVAQALIPADLAPGKEAVRDYLRAIGQEDRWTELQGYVYGPGMEAAPPYPGVLEFFARCRALGIPVSIISHRTRRPFLGPAYDLHTTARTWLERNRFFDPTGGGLGEAAVFFELTKEAKLTRIATQGCTHFVDDLPEFLAEPAFPSGVRRLLFGGPAERGAAIAVPTYETWDALGADLLGR